LTKILKFQETSTNSCPKDFITNILCWKTIRLFVRKQELGVLDYHKSFYEDQSKYSYEVPLTRQQIAAITALRGKQW
jgi:uncharacterized membrane protein (UPF0182 family)